MAHHSRTKWAAAFAAGSAVGALAGLLLAPYSGRKLRRKVRHRTGDTLDRISSKGDKLFKRCEHITGDVVHFVKRSA